MDLGMEERGEEAARVEGRGEEGFMGRGNPSSETKMFTIERSCRKQR
jgi:hypothetical protein